MTEAAMTCVPGSSDGKEIERKAEPDDGAHRDLADQQPHRAPAGRSGRRR